MLLVEAADERADLDAHRFRQRDRVGRDDGHLDLARAKRRGDLESDEARAKDHRAFAFLGLGDDRAAVAQRAQHMDARRAGRRETDGLGAGSEEDRVERARRAVVERERFRLRIEQHRAASHQKFDVLRAIRIRVAQRHPLLGRAAREVVLR